MKPSKDFQRRLSEAGYNPRMRVPRDVYQAYLKTKREISALKKPKQRQPRAGIPTSIKRQLSREDRLRQYVAHLPPVEVGATQAMERLKKPNRHLPKTVEEWDLGDMYAAHSGRMRAGFALVRRFQDLLTHTESSIAPSSTLPQDRLRQALDDVDAMYSILFPTFAPSERPATLEERRQLVRMINEAQYKLSTGDAEDRRLLKDIMTPPKPPVAIGGHRRVAQQEYRRHIRKGIEDLLK